MSLVSFENSTVWISTEDGGWADISPYVGHIEMTADPTTYTLDNSLGEFLPGLKPVSFGWQFKLTRAQAKEWRRAFARVEAIAAARRSRISRMHRKYRNRARRR